MDRIWDKGFDMGSHFKELISKSGFNDVDDLCSILQKGMMQFIQNHSGAATFYSNYNTIARPKWSDVEDYLKGAIDFPELKRRLGC